MNNATLQGIRDLHEDAFGQATEVHGTHVREGEPEQYGGPRNSIYKDLDIAAEVRSAKRQMRKKGLKPCRGWSLQIIDDKGVRLVIEHETGLHQTDYWTVLL